MNTGEELSLTRIRNQDGDYIHDDDAGRSHITNLSIALRAAGWKNDSEKLRSFVHPGSKEIIEIEPGGP
jgi:hypothetical protein